MNYNNIFKEGVSLLNNDKFSEAIEKFNSIDPEVPNEVKHILYYNIGISYKGLREKENALKFLYKSCDLKSDYDLPRIGLFEVYTLFGDWFNGFKFYDWNYVTDTMFHYEYNVSKNKRLDWEDPNTQIPLNIRFKKDYKHIQHVSDEELSEIYINSLNKVKNKVIHIISTQGLGDVVQCSYYINELVKLNPKRIIFSVRPELYRLIANTFKYTNLIEIRMTKLHDDEYDYFIPSFNLIKLFKGDNTPKKPWLKISLYDFEYFKNKLKLGNKKIIGINWKGNPLHHNDKKRSMELEEMITRAPEGKLVSLQFNPTEEDKKLFKKYDILDLSSNYNDCYEMAIIMLLCDEIHTVDSAPAHISAGIGRKTYCYIPKGFEDYRWGISGDCFNYEKIKLVRL